nr:glucosaminidase domain-containing protein [Lentilactobacillus raoultii]
MKAPIEKISRQNHLYPSVMMAQAIVESDFGRSTLSTEANNYFGIKGTYNGQSVTMSTGEYTSKGKHYMTAAQFKKYPDVEASIRDNASLLRHGTLTDPTYYSGTWTTNALTASDAAMALATTYATDMNYGNKLNAVIVRYNLDRLDATDGDTNIQTAGNINEQIEQSLKKELGTSSAAQTKKVTQPTVLRSKITRIPEKIIPRSVFEPQRSQTSTDNEYTLPLNLSLEKLIKSKSQTISH